jgi:hypothetical protein
MEENKQRFGLDSYGEEAKERAGSPAAANPDGSPPLDVIPVEGREPPPSTTRGERMRCSCRPAWWKEGRVLFLLFSPFCSGTRGGDGARERRNGVGPRPRLGPEGSGLFFLIFSSVFFFL